MKTITLTKGLEVIVDDGDYVSLVGFKWYASRAADGNVYAARNVRRDGRPRVMLMHRALLGEPDAYVRHVNGNGLDNRRENLRVIPRKQKVSADV